MSRRPAVQCGYILAFAGEAHITCGREAHVPDSGGAPLCYTHDRHGCWMYLLKRGQYLKVGISTDPKARLLTLIRGDGTLAPADVDGDPFVIALVPGDAATESLFHAVFAEQRDVGEWFRVEGPLADLVERLGGSAIRSQVQTMKAETVIEADAAGVFGADDLLAPVRVDF